MKPVPGASYTGKTRSCLLLASLGTLVSLLFFSSQTYTVSISYPPYALSQWRANWSRRDPVCTERRRVAFVKVHKAASTTVTTILQRFGFSRNLTFALPPKNDIWHLGFFETLKPEKLPPIPKGKVYEILCQHVVYSQEAFKKYLPPDVAVIAAVREPLDRFVSSFLYFHEYPTFVKQKSRVNGNDIMLMREFLKDPEFYEPQRFKLGSLAVNRMSFDFGIPKSQYRNASFVDKYIKMVDEHMEFVLVADHFDASLVILKRKLCWSTKDILYRRQHKGGKRKPSIPEDIRQRLKYLSPSDFQLYDYFSRKFQRIAQAEVNLSEEVSIFQETLKNVNTFCGGLSKSGPQFKHFEKTQFSHEFNITRLDCDYLNFGEEKFVNLLWKRQAK